MRKPPGKPPSQRPGRAAPPMPVFAAKSLGQVPEEARELYASIVHRTVCEHTGSDGFGHCFLYAVGGHYLLLAEKVRMMVYPQAGSLLLLPDPGKPDHWFTFDSAEGGFSRGEFHSWIMAEDGIIIDFSARHYRKYAELTLQHSGVIGQTDDGVFLDVTPSERPAWRRTDHLDYLWTHMDRMPKWVRFQTDMVASQEQSDRLIASLQGPEMKAFHSLLLRNLGRAC